MSTESTSANATLSSPIGLEESSEQNQFGFADNIENDISPSEEVGQTQSPEGEVVQSQEASNNYNEMIVAVEEQPVESGLGQPEEYASSSSQQNETVDEYSKDPWPNNGEGARWTAYVDPQSGQPYFVDNSSGYKTWVQPEDNDFVWGDHTEDVITRHFTKF